MKTKTIESLQQRLKAKGFNPGPIDGIDGLWTFAAWSAPSVLIFRFAWSPTKKPVARKGSAQTTTTNVQREREETLLGPAADAVNELIRAAKNNKATLD